MEESRIEKMIDSESILYNESFLVFAALRLLSPSLERQTHATRNGISFCKWLNRHVDFTQNVPSTASVRPWWHEESRVLLFVKNDDSPTQQQST